MAFGLSPVGGPGKCLVKKEQTKGDSGSVRGGKVRLAKFLRNILTN
jgi:hypothetical protein